MRISGLVIIVATAVLSTACKKSPLADPVFSDAAKYAFLSFDDHEVDLAFTLRSFEETVYLSMDPEADNVLDRAFTLDRLTEEDVDHLEHADLPVADALPVAVGGVSKYSPIESHVIQLMEDQRPVEPYSPDHYTRTFLDGSEECWPDMSCRRMYTNNELTKKNALMEIPYEFLKDFRWIDLNLPPPSDFAEDDELPTETDDPRWGFIARSWTTEIYEGDGGNTAIELSFTVEVWIPRDGRGFVRDGTETNLEGGEWTTDSNGDGGTLRLLALWAQTDLGLAAGDDVIIATTRGGIDNNFQAAEDWLIEEYGER